MSSPTPPPEPGSTFISHVDPDQAAAEALGRALEEAGVRVCLKAWDARPGDLWDQFIPDALRRADRVLILITPAWCKSWYGPEEAAQAVADSRERDVPRRLVPVLYGGVTCADLPYGLRRVVPVEVDGDDWASAVQRLLGLGRRAPAREDPRSVIEGDAEPRRAAAHPTEPETEDPTSNVEEQSGRSRRRTLLIALVIVSAVVLGAWATQHILADRATAWPGPPPVRVLLGDRTFLVDAREVAGADLGQCDLDRPPEAQTEWCEALRSEIDPGDVQTAVVPGYAGADGRVVVALDAKTAEAICALRGMRLPTDDEFEHLAAIGPPDRPESKTIGGVIEADVRGPMQLRGLATGAVEWVRFGGGHLGRGTLMLSPQAQANMTTHPDKLPADLAHPTRQEPGAGHADFGFRCVKEVR